jgi:putative flippase GtrA
MKILDWLKTGKQFIKFAVVGVLNTAIDIGLLNLLLYFGWNTILANTVAFLIAATNSFIWNKYWTFGDQKGDWKKQLPFYLIVVTVGVGISNAFIYVFSLIFGWDINVVKIVSIGAVFSWNFLAPKLLIFRK